MGFRLVSILLGLGLILSFCKKKEEEVKTTNPPAVTPPVVTPPKPVRTFSVSNELKQWGLFKIGSYWIYKDSILPVTDSVYVISAITTTALITYKPDTNAVVETITINFYSHKPLIVPATSTFGSFFGSLTLRSYPYDIITEPVHGAVVFALDSTIIASSPNFGIYGITQNYSISNYLLNTINYGSVRYIDWGMKFTAHVGGLELIYSGKCSWKKNVGLVKNLYRDNFGRPYTLLRYHCVQ